MDLQLMDSVRQLLAEVERLAGEKIAVAKKPELAAPIDFHLGGRGEPRLVFDYRPHPETDVNFLIANQTGHLLRFFSAPAAAAICPHSSGDLPSSSPHRKPASKQSPAPVGSTSSTA